MKKIINTVLTLSLVLLGLLIILKFDICKEAILKAILLCGNVIIPSLFPFTVCLMFLINANALEKIPFLNLLGRPFRLNSEEMAVFLFSLIGGYPTGAKMVSRLYENKKITCHKAKTMICYCVNGGLAFIISIVGNTVLNSQLLGIIIFLSHIISSVIMAFILGMRLKNSKVITKKSYYVSPIDNFVNSTAIAAEAILNICFYVVFFAVASAYLLNFSKKFSILKYISYFLEVTLGVSNTKNVYFIAFLLGFAGFCIWFQVFAVAKSCKPSAVIFILSRIFHGLMSSFFTFFMIKIFKIQIPVISNNILFEQRYYYSSIALSLSLAVLVIFFLLTLTSKKISGNIVEDLL